MTCAASCPVKAISTAIDSLGFAIPKIDSDICVNCGKCQRVCPSINETDSFPPKNTYAAAAKNSDILKKCSSGGIATIIAQSVIKSGGIVYGCDGTDAYHVRHRRIIDSGHLSSIQGSKYVQSDISGVFKDLLSDLKGGKTVLFIGLSCQVAAIKQYVDYDYPNLYCIDIICHGAASQKMLNQDIDYHLKRLNLESIHDLRFRHKYYDNDSIVRIQYGLFFRSGEVQYSFRSIEDPFTFGYSNNQLSRDSCYLCKYANISRVADLTLGDYWGLNQDSKLKNKLGFSLCITHTEKGNELFNDISEDIDFEERSIEEAIKGNPQLIRPTDPHEKLENFRKIYRKYGLSKAVFMANRKLIIKIRILNIAKRIGLVKA